MSDHRKGLSDDLISWIGEQPMFFVASAPSGEAGHVNLSPKGLDALRVFGPHRVAYLDYTGSSAETIAHVRENGRVTLMFCAFNGRPRILRLYGRASAHLIGSARFDELATRFTVEPGARAVIDVEVHEVRTSCGFGVPLMEAVAPRPDMVDWAVAKGEDGLAQYRARKNATSLDGRPAFGP